MNTLFTFPNDALILFMQFSGKHIPYVFYFVSLIPTFLMWLGLERRIKGSQQREADFPRLGHSPFKALEIQELSAFFYCFY
jgi:hypothetical protein